MDIDAVKEYLRIDDDADDMTIELMMNAAKEYIKDAVVMRRIQKRRCYSCLSYRISTKIVC